VCRLGAGNYCGNECGFENRPKRLIARVGVDGTELMVLPKDKILQNVPEHLTQPVTKYICNVSQRRYERLLQRMRGLPDTASLQPVEKEDPLQELEKRLPAVMEQPEPEVAGTGAQLQAQEQGVLQVALNITHSSSLRQAGEYLQAKMATTGIIPTHGRDLMADVETLYSRCFSNNLLRPEELVRREAKNALLNKMNKVKMGKGKSRKISVPQEAKVDFENLSSRGLSKLKEICVSSPRTWEVPGSMTFNELSVDSSGSHRVKSERMPRDFILSGLRSSSKRSVSRGDTAGFLRSKMRLDGRSIDLPDSSRNRPLNFVRPGPFISKEQGRGGVSQLYYTATRKGFQKMASRDSRSTDEAASKTFSYGSPVKTSTLGGQNRSKIHIQLCK
jgi:hypothetical protein